MVTIWVFAGGGEAETRGLLPFLEALFKDCKFERRFPVGLKKNPKKPRTFPSDRDYQEKQKSNARGATGNSLIVQIEDRLIDGTKHDHTKLMNKCPIFKYFYLEIQKYIQQFQT